MADFEQHAVLARYKAEYATLDEQIRAFTERHQALAQIISGLETLLNSPTSMRPRDRPDVDRSRNSVTNSIAVLRFIGRPLKAVDIQQSLEINGIVIKHNTLYKALRRAADRGLLVYEYPGFSLPEWKAAGA